MKKSLTAAVLALGLFAGAVSAADYSYVGAAYTTTDATNRQADAFDVDASFEVTDAIFVTAGYTNGLDSDFDAGVVRVGVGAHNTITDAGNVDLYGQLTSLVVVENARSFDKYNWEAEIGLRKQVTDRFEVRGAAIATNLRDQRFEDVKYFGAVTGEFAFTKNFRGFIGYVGSGDYNEGNIGARWYF